MVGCSCFHSMLVVCTTEEIGFSSCRGGISLWLNGWCVFLVFSACLSSVAFKTASSWKCGFKILVNFLVIYLDQPVCLFLRVYFVFWIYLWVLVIFKLFCCLLVSLLLVGLIVQFFCVTGMRKI